MARKLFIKQWRKHRGKTQAAIADAMETSAASISRIENGVYGYTREKLEGIAAELQCEPGDLLKFDPRKALAICCGWHFRKCQPTSKNAPCTFFGRRWTICRSR